MYSNPYDLGVEVSISDKARDILVKHLNDKWEFETKALQVEHPDQEFVAARMTRDDIHPVWFTKTLGNWKAILMSPLLPNLFELSHDGILGQTYIDEYQKVANTVVLH